MLSAPASPSPPPGSTFPAEFHDRLQVLLTRLRETHPSPLLDRVSRDASTAHLERLRSSISALADTIVDGEGAKEAKRELRALEREVAEWADEDEARERKEPASPVPAALTQHLASIIAHLSRPVSSSSPFPTPKIADAHLLRLLAAHPDRVLPEGKTLASVLTKPDDGANQSTQMGELQKRVEQTMRRAWFDDAIEKLEDASTRTERLAGLHTDLHATIDTLLAPSQRAAVAAPSTISAAASHLSSLLSHLRARAAPARDAALVSISSSLPADTDSAKVYVDAVQASLELAEQMKGDLVRFWGGQAADSGRVGDDILRGWLAHMATQKERESILDFVQGGRDAVIAQVRSWLDSPETLPDIPKQQRLSHRLLAALVSPHAVALPPSPPNTPNALPPPLYTSAPLLFALQNRLQALLVASSLGALVPSSASAVLVGRAWDLLQADGRLTALQDEVARAAGPASSDAESALCEAVGRVLRYEDPVFALLRGRLEKALREELLPAVPRAMRTGREASDRRRQEEVREVKVKGMEELAKEVGEVVRDVEEAIEWVRDVWGDVLDQV